ncbi:hypothetical protein BDW59DRAFT_158497 [Aspergillus cavernicola]|uniref:Fungal N-terminal domain-containing protein n=1 Tax=Aspergillus cavernicola TaxID=176166 RepID=A0ABR4IS46_9EURO
MADPFSVAASVSGVLSLGIEVCKGIIKYCDAWRAVADNIRGMILANKHQITQLHGKLAKCEAASSQAADLYDKIRGVVKKAKYPFLRDSLLGMKDVLSELQANLHTGLHM